MVARVLYLTYDGLLEPLGQSQVWKYLRLLAVNHEITIISYEKSDDWYNASRLKTVRVACKEAGVRWIPLRYHKNPTVLATFFDILHGIFIGLFITLRYQIQIIHARSYVPSVITLSLKVLTKVHYIFDMRGFWVDERVDGGLWTRNSRLYRMAKWFEKRFLLSADCVVSLTHAAVEEMKQFPYLQGKIPHFEVITTCTDLDLFKPDDTTDDKRKNHYRPFTLGYVGSVGVWCLFDETLKCFKLIKERVPNARLHILNRGSHDYIHEHLALNNVDLNSVLVETADHVGVASAMQKMDAGVFFYKPAYSKTASAPTKLGEFLGCGIPCLGNSGVGDMASILENEQVGIALHSFDLASMEEGIDQLLKLTNDPEILERCRHVALNYFSLDEGVKKYDQIYYELAACSL